MPSESETQRLHPSSLFFSLTAQAGRFLLPALIVLFLSRQSRFEALFAIFFIPAVIGAVVRYLSYRYRLDPDELVVRQGIVSRNERHIPYQRIQNIDLTQSLLQRWLGVAVVRIQTAGGDEPEAVMRVLSMSAVRQMRARVFSGRSEPAETEGEAPEHPDSAVHPTIEPSTRRLHGMPSGEIVRFGIISNKGLVVVAALLGLLWQLDAIDPIFREASSWSVVVWYERLERALGPLGFILSAIVAVAVFVVVLRILSVGWAFLRLHDFRLSRTGDDLRTEQGLFTRVTKTIPRHRVQLLSTRSTLLHRLFDRHAVQVRTAGRGSSGDDSASDRLWVAPLIRPRETAQLVREIVPGVDLEAVDWQPIASNARRRLLRRGLAIWSVVAVLAVAQFRLGSLAILLPLGALLVVHAYQYVRHTAWAVVGDTVFYRTGWWVRRMVLARFSKIQVVRFQETPFDRRHGMASLSVDTAGGARIGQAFEIGFLDRGVAEELFESLAAEASTTRFRW